MMIQGWPKQREIIVLLYGRCVWLCHETIVSPYTFNSRSSRKWGEANLLPIDGNRWIKKFWNRNLKTFSIAKQKKYEQLTREKNSSTRQFFFPLSFFFFFHLLLNSRKTIVTPLLLLLLVRVGRRQNGRDLVAAATSTIVLMDPRLQLVQRDELLLLVFPAGGLVEEVSVALRHILGDHLLLGPPLEAQQILQLLPLLPIPFYLGGLRRVTSAAWILLALLGLAGGRGGGAHAGAIADHHIVPHDTTGVRQ